MKAWAIPVVNDMFLSEEEIILRKQILDPEMKERL